MINTSDRPVYQMHLTANASIGWGLIFGTEEDESEQDHSFVYVIPLESDRDNWRTHHYRFPGMKGEKYQEFEARPQNGILVVKTEGVTISFSPLSPLPPVLPTSTPIPPSPYLPYLGHHELVGNFRLFLPLYPVNTIEMEELYKNKGVVLVGLTPEFCPEAFTNTLTHGR